MPSFMSSLPFNTFDGSVYLCLFVAVVMGFMSGLLRSLATIFGYVAAMGLTVALAPRIAQLVTEQFRLPPAQTWVAFVLFFLAAGMAISALLRLSVSEMIGPNVSIPDRVAGAMLGAVRVVLLAVVLVLVFDRLIPAGREPAFLKGSQWRPVLSAAGQQGLRSLPPDVEAYIDRLKKERGL
jgi:membrane protein required for colicin V production